MELPKKRKRPNSTQPAETLPDSDGKVLELIKSKGDNAISRPLIRHGTNLPDPEITKSLKSLIARNLIKEVTNIHNKRSKHYIGVEFEPSKELTGGEWYTDGKLDVEFISILKSQCLKHIQMLKAATAEGISDSIHKSGLFKIKFGMNQIDDIVKVLVLEGEVEEVISTAQGDFSSVPFGRVCYRRRREVVVKTGAFSSMPCGVCPRISDCTPDGIISPITCTYMKKWLDF